MRVRSYRLAWSQTHVSLRQELKATFAQMTAEIASTVARAAANAHITDAIVTPGADGPNDAMSDTAHFQWAQNALTGGYPEWLVSKTNVLSRGG